MSHATPPSIFEQDLGRVPANHVPLSPLGYLRRAAAIYPGKVAVIHGDRRTSYAQLYDRARRFAAALIAAGVRRGDTVAVLAPNIPALLEAHYGVPMAGAVLNALNTRLDAATITFILEHSESRVLIVDREWGETAAAAIERLGRDILVIEIEDPDARHPHSLAHSWGAIEYETFLAGGDPDAAFGTDPTGPAWMEPLDEWDAIALNYTSGTTGNPKGVVYHHRGAYLNALGNAWTLNLRPESAYLWTLPMFHCNGWTYTWGVTAAGGTHVCLRRVEAAAIFDAIVRHGVTHMCGAPIVLNMLVNAPAGLRAEFAREAAARPRVSAGTGGAAPPSAVLEAMASLGFDVIHLYGLTECYGPATICAEQIDWADLPQGDRARLKARQGVPLPTMDRVDVFTETGAPVPADGATIGEIGLRGNTVMKGYLKNPKATADALGTGWFLTGDLAVKHPDGYIEVKDRSKDIIISGGENISSLEVEEALYRHPAVLEAAVVAQPDPKWGETPCAFVTLKPDLPPGAEPVDEAAIIAWCRDHLAHFKVPRHVVFQSLPKTSTGKIQKTVLRDLAKGDTQEGAKGNT
ncbi:acyl-CoA synthetase [Skermanella stibiiresistens SB22]|uniref:3-methylmercaptopropionyl-CoA ligase n=1 Tax=Skermanella stibiiresistens SB22 TaxID=1385369 RepID=W9GZN2_9PROT|nr:AMP-binding protein [Skermanella stibiiresistens]EWY37917.1 acyl-CoA synthetase [Skermanella stibiiresistens SB22]